MRTVYEERHAEAVEIERTLVQGTARLCTSYFQITCKAIQPHKTAEWLAASTKQSVRAASYELSGEREPSGRSISFLVSLIAKWPL
jgi:hypothetical protein